MLLNFVSDEYQLKGSLMKKILTQMRICFTSNQGAYHYTFLRFLNILRNQEQAGNKPKTRGAKKKQQNDNKVLLKKSASVFEICDRDV